MSWIESPNTGGGLWKDVSLSGTNAIGCVQNGSILVSNDSGSTWNLTLNTGGKNWSSVSLSGSNALACVSEGSIWTSGDSGVTWTENLSTIDKYWKGVSLSGSNAVSCDNDIDYGGSIWYSSDAGATWSETSGTSGESWYSVSISGSKAVACSYGGSIWTSSNSGVTWTKNVSTNGNYWQSVSISGNNAVACVYGGSVWLSTNSGLTWTEVTSLGSQNWNKVSIDGAYIAATIYGDSIQTSIDTGATWISCSFPPGGSAPIINDWSGVSVSNNKLIACVYGKTSWHSRLQNDFHLIFPQTDGWTGLSISGNNALACSRFFGSILRSSDAGATWAQVPNTSDINWRGVSISGNNALACNFAGSTVQGSIWKSNNSGATWAQVPNTSGINWQSVSISGSNAVACLGYGYLYTSVDYGQNWTPETSFGQKQFFNVYIDGSTVLAYVYEGSIYYGVLTGGSYVWNISIQGTFNYAGLSISGSNALVSVKGGSIWKSTDSGAHFNQVPNTSGINWSSVSISGNNAAACVEGGSLWTSSDSGDTWTEYTSISSKKWDNVSLSGNNGIAGVNRSSIYYFTSLPVVSYINPTYSLFKDGNTTINGYNFSGPLTVSFGPDDGTVLSSSSNDIGVYCYSSLPGTVPVVVSCDSVVANVLTSGANNFTFIYYDLPNVTSISPSSGTTSGNTQVVLTGENFTGVTVVKFGSDNASSFTIDLPTQITAYSPSHVAGQVNITVTNPGGTSSTGQGNLFTYYAPPTITSFSATLNPSTNQVTLAPVFPAPNTGSINQSIGSVSSGTNYYQTISNNTTYILTVTNPLNQTITSTQKVTVPITSQNLGNEKFCIVQGQATVTPFQPIVAQGGSGVYTYSIPGIDPNAPYIVMDSHGIVTAPSSLSDASVGQYTYNVQVVDNDSTPAYNTSFIFEVLAAPPPFLKSIKFTGANYTDLTSGQAAYVVNYVAQQVLTTNPGSTVYYVSLYNGSVGTTVASDSDVGIPSMTIPLGDYTLTYAICLLETSNIMMTDGSYKNIKDISEGDLLRSALNGADIRVMYCGSTLISNLSKVEKTNQPYRIPVNFFGENHPSKDVLISGHHRVFFTMNENIVGIQVFKLLADIEPLTMEEALSAINNTTLRYYHIGVEGGKNAVFCDGIPVETLDEGEW